MKPLKTKSLYALTSFIFLCIKSLRRWRGGIEVTRVLLIGCSAQVTKYSWAALLCPRPELTPEVTETSLKQRQACGTASLCLSGSLSLWDSLSQDWKHTFTPWPSILAKAVYIVFLYILFILLVSLNAECIVSVNHCGQLKLFLNVRNKLYLIFEGLMQVLSINHHLIYCNFFKGSQSIGAHQPFLEQRATTRASSCSKATRKKKDKVKLANCTILTVSCHKLMFLYTQLDVRIYSFLCSFDRL